MNLYLIIITSFFIFPSLLWAQGQVVISEASLKKMIEDNPPSVQQIEASFLAVKSEQMSKSDQYSFRLNGEGQVNESRERLLNNFDGAVTRASSAFSLGVTKPTRYGVDVGVTAFTNKASNAFVSDAATTGVSMNLAIDLFQNFLGRNSNNDLKKSEWSVKRAELEKKSQLKTFESNVRKIYWGLIANNEQKKLLSSLVKTAEEQYKQALKRKKQGVADSGEVARYRSEWTSRKASLLSLEYNRSNLVKSLKELLPGLSSKKILLAPYNVEQIRMKVLACTGEISKYDQAPMEFTYYDDIAEILGKEQELERRVARTYDDPKIKLVGEYASVGRDFGYTAAQANFSDDPRDRRSVGLQVSIPLGSRTRDSREVKEMAAKNRYQALAQSNLLKVKAYHEETAAIIATLQRVIRNQQETNKSLTQSLKLSRRKYKQARISLQELISEQDARLNSQLNEIDTNLIIINTLMDYFGIFGEVPCNLNRI